MMLSNIISVWVHYNADREDLFMDTLDAIDPDHDFANSEEFFKFMIFRSKQGKFATIHSRMARGHSAYAASASTPKKTAAVATMHRMGLGKGKLNL
eukprot:TRINITY_DN3524_c0_g1_i1.p1 TRINITY_DN3524_c0_g1~~TRINITY_DN3524_c0_g1_i1.p1  ORF type:complete len:96 (+),score=4.03 TRINITY_DN3524_c0_g1_i1:140-427(+)